MATGDAGEFHPYVFCVLFKAGRDPWEDIRFVADRLGLGELPKRPPLVRHLPASSNNINEGKAEHGE